MKKKPVLFLTTPSHSDSVDFQLVHSNSVVNLHLLLCLLVLHNEQKNIEGKSRLFFIYTLITILGFCFHIINLVFPDVLCLRTPMVPNSFVKKFLEGPSSPIVNLTGNVLPILKLTVKIHFTRRQMSLSMSISTIDLHELPTLSLVHLQPQ